MLPRINRITKDKEYELVFKTGRSRYSELLGVKAVKTGISHSRFGIIVSNKISKQAITRNRLKRQFREILKQESGRIKPGYDIVIIAQAGIIGKSGAEIKAAIMRQFEQLRLLNS